VYDNVEFEGNRAGGSGGAVRSDVDSLSVLV